MEDAQGKAVLGRTNWKRFAAVAVPTTAAAGAMTMMMANGALAASFAVSGQSFKLRADKLVGHNFEQFPGLDKESNGDLHPVAVSVIGTVERLDNLCQSVKVPVPVPIPGVDYVTLTITAGKDPDHPVKATDLVVDAESLQGDAEFTNIVIGQDAGTLRVKGQSGYFGQQASDVTITNLKQTAWATTAGTFSLNGLGLSLKANGAECY